MTDRMAVVDDPVLVPKLVNPDQVSMAKFGKKYREYAQKHRLAMQLRPVGAQSEIVPVVQCMDYSLLKYICKNLLPREHRRRRTRDVDLTHIYQDWYASPAKPFLKFVLSVPKEQRLFQYVM